MVLQRNPQESARRREAGSSRPVRAPFARSARGPLPGALRRPLSGRVRGPAPILAAGFSTLALAAGLAYGGSWEIGASFPAPSGDTNGLTWDGQALWHTNDVNPIVYRIDPNTGKVIGTVSSQIDDQGDLEFAGGSLWIVSEYDHYVKRMDPKSGKTVDSIKVLGLPDNQPGRNRFPEYQLEGLTYDGRNIWTDGNHSTLVRIDLKTRAQHMYEMPYEMGYIDGLTWAFDHLWVVTNNATIYELDPCTLGVLDKFAAPANVSSGPEGFAFDGENLWFADNDRDQIYKIILKDKILTKRSAEAVRAAGAKREALAKAAANLACNEGTLLTPPPDPVSLRTHPRNSAAGRLFATDATLSGSPGIVDALGRLRNLPVAEAK